MSENHDSAAAVQTITAERFAEALVTAIAKCEDEGRPFTDMQKCDLIESALLSFDGLHALVEGHFLLDNRLRMAGTA
jgi:hypothetical protein